MCFFPETFKDLDNDIDGYVSFALDEVRIHTNGKYCTGSLTYLDIYIFNG